MSRLLLVRHAETGSGGRLQGWSDVPLNDLGVEQARRLRERLAKEQWSVVFSSDLRRAVETAQVAAGEAAVVQRFGLREASFGDWEWQIYADLQARWPQEVQRWQADPVNAAPPGGESLAQVAQRCVPVMEELLAHDSVLVVGHSVSLRVLLCQLLGLPLSHYWRLRLDHTGLSVVDTYPEGAILSLLNDRCHLEGLA